MKIYKYYSFKFNAIQQLKKEIQKINNKSVGDYLSGLSNESNPDYSLWQVTKRLKRPILQNPPNRNADGTWAKYNIQ